MGSTYSYTKHAEARRRNTSSTKNINPVMVVGYLWLGSLYLSISHFSTFTAFRFPKPLSFGRSLNMISFSILDFNDINKNNNNNNNNNSSILPVGFIQSKIQ